MHFKQQVATWKSQAGMGSFFLFNCISNHEGWGLNFKRTQFIFLTICFQTFLIGRTFLILLSFLVFYQVDANSDVKKRLQSNKWYFVTKIVLTYCEKKLFKWSRKTFEIRGWRLRVFKIFEITWTIYTNIERSEHFFGKVPVF